MKRDENEKSLTILQHLEKPLDAIGSFGAYFTMFLILFMYLNSNFSFLPTDVEGVLLFVREVAIIAVVAAKGLEFALYRGFLATIVFLALCAAVAVFMFFPESLPAFLVG